MAIRWGRRFREVEYEELREQYEEMLESAAWREVCVPALRQRQLELLEQMGTNTRLEERGFRELQYRFQLLEALIENPDSVLWPEFEESQ